MDPQPFLNTQRCQPLPALASVSLPERFAERCSVAKGSLKEFISSVFLPLFRWFFVVFGGFLRCFPLFFCVNFCIFL